MIKLLESIINIHPFPNQCSRSIIITNYNLKIFLHNIKKEHLQKEKDILARGPFNSF